MNAYIEKEVLQSALDALHDATPYIEERHLAAIREDNDRRWPHVKEWLRQRREAVYAKG